jgi:hypothetical protein
MTSVVGEWKRWHVLGMILQLTKKHNGGTDLGIDEGNEECMILRKVLEIN